MNFSTLLKNSNRSFTRKQCLHPDAKHNCKNGIIKAHSIQRNGGLSEIAEGGHVYGVLRDSASMIKTGEIKIGLVGIANASTFNGFCGYHDSETFAPVEREPFIGSSIQYALIGYRALCRDYYMKLAMIENAHANNSSFEDGDANEEMIRMMNEWLIEGAESGIREFKYYKALYEQTIREHDFDDLHFYTVFLSTKPDILMTGSFQVEYDFYGNLLQDLSNTKKRATHMTLSILPTESGGVASFVWIGDSDANNHFIKSLYRLSDDSLCNTAIKMAYEYSDNIYASPNWWDSLSDETRRDLLTRLESGTPKAERNSLALANTMHRYVAWQVAKRNNNIGLP